MDSVQKSDKHIKPFLTDAFKIVTSLLSSIKHSRREKIKKELDNKYKSIAENDATAEKLFGDNISDKIKALGVPKVNLVNTGKRPFLGPRPRMNSQGKAPKHLNWGHASHQHKGYRPPMKKYRGQTFQKTKMKVSTLFNLKNTSDNFKAGKTKYAVEKWEKLTGKKWIISFTKRYKLELNNAQYQTFIPNQYSFSDTEQEKIKTEIENFVHKGIIE